MPRRRGVAKLLLTACEDVGAAAGFTDFYIQVTLLFEVHHAHHLPKMPSMSCRR